MVIVGVVFVPQTHSEKFWQLCIRVILLVAMPTGER